ncbi:MAG: hypothetical protein ACFCD0_14405 [Gemmataceae bacterium]
MIRRRRRRNTNDLAFGLDSFLDIIANVIGIIIRMILVVWVGASAYYTAQYQVVVPERPKPTVFSGQFSSDRSSPKKTTDERPNNSQGSSQPSAELFALPTLPMIEEPEDTLVVELRREKRKLEAAGRLLGEHLAALPARKLEERQTREKVKSLQIQQARLATVAQTLALRLQNVRNFDHLTKNALTDVLTKRELLKAEIARLEKLPKKTNTQFYQAPVSREVRDSKEVFFECRGGRVSFIDTESFLAEVETNLFTTLPERLRQRPTVTYSTRAIGAFRMRWTAERYNAGFGDTKVHVQWVIAPIKNERGETLGQALAKNSRFRNVVDFEDPRTAVVTFCVYPDSFGVYRKLRNYLYQRKMEVAGRPLPFGAQIGASSRDGRAARGQ